MSKKTTIIGRKPTAEEAKAAKKAMSSPEFLDGQAKAIEEFEKASQGTAPSNVFDVKLASRGIELQKEFWRIFYLTDVKEITAGLLAVADELENEPELLKYVSEHSVSKALQVTLLSRMRRAAIAGAVPDSTRLLYNYFESFLYNLDVEKMFFADAANLLQAGCSKQQPLKPIQDISMFECLSGGDAAVAGAANALTFSKDIGKMNGAFAFLKNSKDKQATSHLLREQMTVSCLYELFLHSAHGGELPAWLEYKLSLLFKLYCLTSDDCERMLDGRTLAEFLCEPDEFDDMTNAGEDEF